MRALGAFVLLWLSTTIAIAAEEADGQPPFRDFDGQPRSIASYTGNGQWLVVMIWAHDCHVCNMEAEQYAQFHETHKDANARVLGVSLDGEARKTDAAAFIQRHDLPFPNLIGEPQATMLYYRMLTGAPFLGTPTILIYEPEGTLRAAQAGAVPVDVIEAYIAKHSARQG